MTGDIPPTDETAPKRYSAPALEKGLHILEILAEQDTGLSQSEIARAMQRSVSEIFRMLVVLTDRGYVMQDPATDRYVLTSRLFEVAHRTPLIRRLTTLAAPLMGKLAREINQSTHLSIVSDGFILIVGQIDPPGNHVMSVRLGARLEIWRASSGRVITAFSDADTVDDLMARVPMPSGMTEDRLRADLAGIRARGHEITDSFVARGIVNIAAPVSDHTGRAVAAITVPHLERFNDPIDFATCARQLIETANAISRGLGGQQVPAYGDLNRD